MTATWSDRMLWLLLRFERVKPKDLPPAPWTLSDSRGRETPSVMGGTFATVTNTKAWLESIRMDADQGPDGPRAKYGGLESDLGDLDILLKHKAAREGRLFLCVQPGCGWLLEADTKPERCYCGVELGDQAGWRAERWAEVEGPHTKIMNKKTQGYGF